MQQLSDRARRVLGVLIEKAQTTPAQYPMTLNGIISGSNQKNNRHPVMSLTEDQVLGALDELRDLDLVHEVMLSGSRVAKYKHQTRDVLDRCACSIDVIASILPYDDYVAGETVLRMRQGQGERMTIFRTAEGAKSAVTELRRAQAEAEIRCF